MHFKEDFKRFAKKTVIKYTTLQKGRWNFFQIFIWSTYDLIFLNLSWEWGGKPQMSIRCHPERHWSVQLSCHTPAQCTSIMDIKKEAATMLQARAPPSGFPSPGDGKWSYNRLNVIVVLLTFTLIITLFHCAWWGLESSLTSQTLALILNFGTMSYSGAGEMDIYKWKHWISSSN